jgi:hypothetical protein
MVVAESVAFDEDENGLGVAGPEIIIGYPSCFFFDDCDVTLPAVSSTAAGDEDVFPQETFDDNVSGWLYLNLDDENDDDGPGAQQSWVTVIVQAEGIYSAAFDAAWLGNGCSPVVGISEYTEYPSAVMPGPAEDVNP